jgi:type II secretory pathway component GspD/PulD (secretin)
MFLGYFNSGIDIGAMLDALVADKKAQLLANPMILTVNHKLADIKMVDEFPYTNLSTDTSGRSNYLTQFMPVGIKLAVTPHVLKDEGGDYVKLEMEPEVSFTTGSTNGVPLRSVRSSHSVANVRSGQTLVIGGIFSDDSQDTANGVPGLSKIPVIQHFFKHTEKTKTRSELMVFVTPTVYDSPEQVTWDKMVEMNGTPAKDVPTFQSSQARAETRRD